MIITFRAAVAVALLAGFYVLVAAFTVGTVALDVAAVTHGHAGGIKVGFLATLGVVAMLRGVFVIGRRGNDEQPGLLVTPQQEPELWRTVTELATQVQTRVPDEIRLVPEVNAAVSEDTSMLGLRPGRRYMYVGMPLLLTLTVDEMRAVLCHELGHYSGAHTRLGGITYQGRTALVRTIGRLHDHPIIRSAFTAYAKLYLRVSQAVSRRQELEADASAVAIAGRGPMAEALRKVRGSATAWGFYLSAYGGLIGPARARPADIFAGYYAFMRQPSRQAEAAKVSDAPEERSPYDSHPSLAERIAAIQRLPEPAVRPDQRPALALLADPQRTALAIQQTMLSDEVLHLPVADWPDILTRAMHAQQSEALKDVFTVAAQMLGVAQPTVDTLLRILANGGANDMAVRLQALQWQGEEPRTMVANVITGALQGLLVESGRARWAFSWSDVARLTDRAGVEVDLSDLVRRAIDDPRQVGALHQGLMRHGITPATAPAPL